MCLANHSSSVAMTTPIVAMLNNYTTPLGGGGFGDMLLDVSHHDVYGYQSDGGDNYYYSTSASSVAMTTETTTPLASAVADDGPQGIESVYKLSFMWLVPLFVTSTTVLSCFFSLVFGGNKKGEVDPRYLLPVCDYLCCCLPEGCRKLFRCADTYSPVEVQNLPPIHENYMDTEMIFVTEATAKGKPVSDSEVSNVITPPAKTDKKAPVEEADVVTGSDENVSSKMAADKNWNRDT